MNEFKELMTEIDRFTEERDWDQFHNPKDLARIIDRIDATLFGLFPNQ